MNDQKPMVLVCDDAEVANIVAAMVRTLGYRAGNVSVASHL